MHRDDKGRVSGNASSSQPGGFVHRIAKPGRVSGFFKNTPEVREILCEIYYPPQTEQTHPKGKFHRCIDINSFLENPDS
jgi:hypothetical protein